MKKRILSFLLAVLLLVSLLPVTALAGDDEPQGPTFFVDYDERREGDSPTAGVKIGDSNTSVERFAPQPFTKNTEYTFHLVLPEAREGETIQPIVEIWVHDGHMEGEDQESHWVGDRLFSSIGDEPQIVIVENDFTFTPDSEANFEVHVYWTQEEYDYCTFGGKYTAEFEWEGNGEAHVDNALNQKTCGNRTKVVWDDGTAPVLAISIVPGDGAALELVRVEQDNVVNDNGGFVAPDDRFAQGIFTVDLSEYPDGDGAFVNICFRFTGSEGEPQGPEPGHVQVFYNGCFEGEQQNAFVSVSGCGIEEDTPVAPDAAIPFTYVSDGTNELSFMLSPVLPEDPEDYVFVAEPIVEVNIFDGNEGKANKRFFSWLEEDEVDGDSRRDYALNLSRDEDEGTFGFTIPLDSDSFVSVSVFWTQREKYDSLQPRDGEIAAVYRTLGQIRVEYSLPEGAEERGFDTFGDGDGWTWWKAILTDNCTSLELRISDNGGIDPEHFSLMLGGEPVSSNGYTVVETEEPLREDIAYPYVTYTWDVSKELQINGKPDPGPNPPDGGNDIEVIFTNCKSVSGNVITYQIGETDVTLTVAGADVEPSDDRYRVLVPRNNMDAVTFTVGDSFDSEAMEVALRGDQNFGTVLALTGNATSLAAHDGGLPDWVNLEIRSKNAPGPNPPVVQSGVQFQLNGPSRGTVNYTVGSTNGYVSNLEVENPNGITSNVIEFEENVTVSFTVESEDIHEVHVNCSDEQEVAVSEDEGTYSFTAAAGKGYSILVAFGQQDFPWYAISYGNSANLSQEHGSVTVERIHCGDNVFTNIAAEVNEEARIYPMSKLVGGNSDTSSPEYDPEKDTLLNYRLAYSDGDIFIAKDTDGVVLDYKFVPEYGYQVTDMLVNEDESLLDDFSPSEKQISTFSFVTKANSNVHFLVKFTKTEDSTNVEDASNISGASIANGGNAASSGNLALTVADTTKDTTIEDAVSTFDIKLDNVVSKGGEKGSWNTNVTEFVEPITLTLTLDTSVFSGTAYSIVREHDSEKEELEADYNPATGELTFQTNRFSSYTIINSHAAMIGDTSYDSFADALAAAKSGDTVKLLQSAETDVAFIPNGVTLDLNGKTLTAAEGAVGIGAGKIIDSNGKTKGLLKVNADELMLAGSNGSYVPLYDAQAEGYRFFKADVKSNREGSKILFTVKLDDSFESTGYDLIKSSTGGAKLAVDVTWKQDDDMDGFQRFTYVASMVNTVANDPSHKAFTFTIGGLTPEMGTVTVTPCIVGAGSVKISNNTYDYAAK